MGHALHGLGAGCHTTRTMGLAAACPIPPYARVVCVVYATLHLLVFAQVYIGWSGAILLEELAERPYVLVGFLSWLILVPLGNYLGKQYPSQNGPQLAEAAQAHLWSGCSWLAASSVAIPF